MGRSSPGERPRLVVLAEPEGAVAEAYRSIRTSLLYSSLDEPRMMVAVTSAGPYEGKSLTCANLAVVLAQAGKKVLLADCDLRRPSLHRVFGTGNTRGVVEIVAGEAEVADCMSEPLDGLKVIAAGHVPPNPSELLGTVRFSGFLKGVREEFDYVILDTPPIQPVSDAAVVAAQTDGVIFVIDAQNTRKISVRRGVRSIEAVGSRVIGTILNNVSPSETAYQDYFHAYIRDTD